MTQSSENCNRRLPKIAKTNIISILVAIAAPLLLCGPYLAELALSSRLVFKPTLETAAWLEGTGSLEQARKENEELKAENTRLENTISDQKASVEKERNDVLVEIFDFKEKRDAHEMDYLMKFEGEKMELKNTIAELQKVQGLVCSDQAKVGTGEVSAEQDRTETEELKAENKKLDSLLLEYQRKLTDLQASIEMERKDALTEFVSFKEKSDARLVAIFKKHEGEKMKLDTTIKELEEAQHVACPPSRPS
jgi:predicted nucleic-acid-binding protein